MQLTFQHGDDVITLQAEPECDGWRVRLPDGSEHSVTARRLPGGVLQITEGERVFRVPFANTPRGLEVSLGGDAFTFTVPDSRKAGGGRKRSSGALTAPMSGVVVEVKISEGQAVEAYQPLVIIEAMKVYATTEAPFAGTISAIHVQPGQRVEQGVMLVDVLPAPEAAS